MDLFTITCTTCKSRLKVRDQSAVGQILACPKCGGMVMVKPPPAWQDGGQQKSDLPTATELTTPPGPAMDQTFDSSAFDLVDELLSDAPPKASPPPSFTPPPSATPSPAKPRFVGGPPRRQTPPAGTVPAASTPPAKTAASSIPPAPAPPSPAPPPPAEADSLATAKLTARAASTKFWIFMAGSIILGISLALGTVMLVLFLRPTPQAVAQQPQQPEPPSANHDANDDSKALLPKSPASLEPFTPAGAISTVGEQPVPPAAAAPQVAVVPQPPESDPVGLITNTPAAAPAEPVISTQPLARFDRLLSDSEDPIATAAPPAAETIASAPPDTTPPRPLAPRPPPREIDVTRRLADPIASIETAGTPLADFVQLISDMSTIPITLDLPLAPATAESPVVLRAANATVGSALKDALTRLRLEYAVIDDQLLVRRPEPSPFAALTHPIKDLAGDVEQASELVDLVKSVVEPVAWEGEAGGSLGLDAAKTSLVITHRRAVQFQVLTAVEKLRAARKPPLAHVLKFEHDLFKVESRWAQAEGPLERPISLNYSQPTRLLTILDRLGEMAGVRIVVDWIDVASAGWNPAGEARLLVANQPLAAALDALLDPLDLTWRIVDSRTIQVVTPARLNEQHEFEFYKVDDLLSGSSGEAIVQRARSALGEGLFRDTGGGGELRYDPATQCLLAWLAQPKQRELETLLANWRVK